MRWVLGLLMVMSVGRALAQETPASNEEFERQYGATAYDQAVIRFNTDIQDFPAWEVFESRVLSKIPPGTMGRCYALSGGSLKPVDVSRVRFDKVTGEGWKKTTGKGWRLLRADRTFVEYRVNTKDRMLVRMEGVKPRLFFAQTRRICEFPL